MSTTPGTDLTDLIHERLGIDGTIPRTVHPVTPVDEEGFSNNVLIQVDGDMIHIGYITHDSDPADFWSDADGLGEFRKFARGDDPKAMIEKLENEGKLVFVVERYSHGQEHYSVAGTQNYPDRRWDVGICGIHIPDDEVQEMYRKALTGGAPPEAARVSAAADTNAILDQYSRTVNGDVHGIVTETWRREGDHVRALDHQSCWNFIGSEYAVEALRDAMPDQEPALDL